MHPFTKAAIFYAMTLAQSVGLALFVAPILGHFALLLVMMTPLVSVLVMKLVVTREGYQKGGWSDLGLGRLGLKQWPMALGLPFLILLLSYGVIWLTGLAQFTVPPGYGFLGPLDFVLSLVVTMVVCFGEEIGWRGYLLPKLMSFGHRRALLISGVLQGLWHVPLIVFTTLYHGAGNPFVVIPLFLVTMTIAGILFGYLRIVSKSTWPAVITHGVFNIYWTLFVAYTVSDSVLATEYLAGESGILTIAAMAVLAWILIRRMENPQNGVAISTDLPNRAIAEMV
jgi:membrane protease YdiL (CAAX protease family)